jgi:hypothetical protein
MSYVHTVATRSSTDTSDEPKHEHPRGRGFSILSRLAREQGPAAPAPLTAPEPEVALEAAPEVEAEVEVKVAPVVEAEVEVEAVPADSPEDDPAEWTAPVLLFDRPQPAPRHRLDVETEPTLRSS